MRSFIIAASALALVAGSAHAQHESSITVSRGSFAVAPFGGYMISQAFFTGPLNSSLSVQNAPLYGVQGSLPLAPTASLIGSLAYSSGTLKAGIPIIGG